MWKINKKMVKICKIKLNKLSKNKSMIKLLVKNKVPKNFPRTNNYYNNSKRTKYKRLKD